MRRLLFLVHRIPYPPNKGDKISSFNILRHFSRTWKIALGTYVDDPEDWQYVENLKEYCDDCCILPLPRSRKLTSSVRSVLTGEPLSIGYYRNQQMLDWLNGYSQDPTVGGIYVYGSSMARFVRDAELPPETPFILGADDVDSEKFAGYAEASAWPMSLVYARESRTLLEFEREMARRSSMTVFISEHEASLFRRRAPDCADKIMARKHGVDSDYFDPARDYENPYKSGERVFVFTGAMDYRPNVDAVAWFCKEVLPFIRNQFESFRFYIVGMNPSAEVKRLGELPGVIVTGAVPDVRPYLKYAHCACLPLQIARGIQNKALEALAMSLPVLGSRAAMTGIVTPDDAAVYLADDPASMIEKGLELLAADRIDNISGRECVRANYNWDTNLRHLESVLDGFHKAAQ